MSVFVFDCSEQMYLHLSHIFNAASVHQGCCFSCVKHIYWLLQHMEHLLRFSDLPFICEQLSSRKQLQKCCAECCWGADDMQSFKCVVLLSVWHSLVTSSTSQPSSGHNTVTECLHVDLWTLQLECDKLHTVCGVLTRGNITLTKKLFQRCFPVTPQKLKILELSV